MEEIIRLQPIESRKELLNLKNNRLLDTGVSIVYVYYFMDNSIKYPIKNGKIIYIGEAKREKEPTGKRFGQHISKNKKKGSDTGSNITLSGYFHNDYSLCLKIFKVKDDERKKTERYLIYSHIELFGCPPIAQSSIPKTDNNKNTITEIYNCINEHRVDIINLTSILEGFEVN